MCSFKFKIPCSWTSLDFSLMRRLAEMKSLTQSLLNFYERYASKYFYSTLVNLFLVSRLHLAGSPFCDGKITLLDGRFLGISTTEIKRLVNYWNSGPTKLRDCWNFWNYRVSRIARALGCWVLVLWELGSLGPPGL